MQTSPYQTFEELISTETAKNAPAAAEVFYSDKSKNFDERIRAFLKYGKTYDHFSKPDFEDEKISTIIELYLAEVPRYKLFCCIDAIRAFVSSLSSKRRFVRSGKYSEAPRNYTASNEAQKRLYMYYIEKLIAEDIAFFEND